MSRKIAAWALALTLGAGSVTMASSAEAQEEPPAEECPLEILCDQFWQDLAARIQQLIDEILEMLRRIIEGIVGTDPPPPDGGTGE